MRGARNRNNNIWFHLILYHPFPHQTQVYPDCVARDDFHEGILNYNNASREIIVQRDAFYKIKDEKWENISAARCHQFKRIAGLRDHVSCWAMQRTSTMIVSKVILQYLRAFPYSFSLQHTRLYFEWCKRRRKILKNKHASAWCFCWICY